MKTNKYAIELVFRDECNLELAATEFSRALEFPKKMFSENFQFMTLRYKEEERALAADHCLTLNLELSSAGYNQVVFRIKEI